MADRTVEESAAPETHVRVEPTASGLHAGAQWTVAQRHAPIQRATAAREGTSSLHPAQTIHQLATDTMVWRRIFPGLVEQAAKARAFVRGLLEDTCWVDDAEFIAAELINNALLHTKSGRPGEHFMVELLRWASSVRVGVYDLGGDGRPDLQEVVAGTQPGADSDLQDVSDAGEGAGEDLRADGRGLIAVRRLAHRVGCDGDAATGHVVWASLTDATEPEPLC